MVHARDVEDEGGCVGGQSRNGDFTPLREGGILEDADRVIEAGQVGVVAQLLIRGVVDTEVAVDHREDYLVKVAAVGGVREVEVPELSERFFVLVHRICCDSDGLETVDQASTQAAPVEGHCAVEQPVLRRQEQLRPKVYSRRAVAEGLDKPPDRVVLREVLPVGRGDNVCKDDVMHLCVCVCVCVSVCVCPLLSPLCLSLSPPSLSLCKDVAFLQTCIICASL